MIVNITTKESHSFIALDFCMVIKIPQGKILQLHPYPGLRFLFAEAPSYLTISDLLRNTWNVSCTFQAFPGCAWGRIRRVSLVQVGSGELCDGEGPGSGVMGRVRGAV